MGRTSRLWVDDMNARSAQFDLEAYLARLDIPEKGKAYVRTAWASPPARRPQNKGGNVISQFASWKNGCSTPLESLNELAAAYELDYSQIVQAFRSQPPQIKIRYCTEAGKEVVTYHYPDFLVLESEAVGFLEIKPEEKLIKISEKTPGKFIRQDEGGWRGQAGEKSSAEYGFFYRVKSSAEFDLHLTWNLRHLAPYFRAEGPTMLESVRRQILSEIHANEGVSAKSIWEVCRLETADEIWQLVARREIYVDLRRCRLTDLDRVQLFSDAEIAKAQEILLANKISPQGVSPICKNDTRKTPPLINGHTHKNFGSFRSQQSEFGPTPPEPDSGNSGAVESPAPADNDAVRRIQESASLEDIQEANRRYTLINDPALAQRQGISERTLRRWHASYRHAQLHFGTGYDGLLPRIKDRGNRISTLSDIVIQIADEVIKDEFLTLKQKTRIASYGILQKMCENKGLEAPCYSWFADRIKKISLRDAAFARRGRRAAYQHEGPIQGYGPSPHGDYPLQVAYADSTPIDVLAVDEETGVVLGRPWLSVLICGHSRRVLAMVLVFDPPSHRTMMLLLRDCVRRFGRFPESIVTDNGKEFYSTLYESLLARYGSIPLKRPPARPRFGSIIEKFFGSTNTMVFANLKGNTQGLKHVRETTKSTNPARHALWPLNHLYDLLCDFLFRVYDNRVHTTLGISPKQQFDRGVVAGGHRRHTAIAYDDDFIMNTLPTTPRTEAKIIPGKGIKVSYLLYWNELFRRGDVEGKTVSVKFDPYDLSVAYAYVNKSWVRCLSQYHSVFKGRTHKEIQLACLALRQKRRGAAREYYISAKRLAEFIQSAEGQEKLLEQRRKDLALRKILSPEEVRRDKQPHSQSNGSAKADGVPSPEIERVDVQSPGADEKYDDF